MIRSVTVTRTEVVEVAPFAVPNYLVPVQDGSESPPLSAATPEQLSAMCDEWRAAVFAKAGKVDPMGGAK